MPPNLKRRVKLMVISNVEASFFLLNRHKTRLNSIWAKNKSRKAKNEKKKANKRRKNLPRMSATANGFDLIEPNEMKKESKFKKQLRRFSTANVFHNHERKYKKQVSTFFFNGWF